MSPKVVQIFTIVIEIFLALILVSGYIRHGLPTSAVYWVAVVIEIGIGIVVCLFYKRYVNNQNQKKWNIFANIVTLVGFILPIVLSGTTDFLKPAGSTWIYSLLTFGVYYVYRVIKKQPIAPQDASSGRYFTTAKVLHWIALSTILVMIMVVLVLLLIGKSHIIAEEPIVSIIFTIVCVPFLGFGLLFPRLMKKVWKSGKSNFSVYFIYAVQLSTFWTVAFIGFLGGTINGLSYVSLPLTILGGAALISCFPTAKRWQEWLAGTTAK